MLEDEADLSRADLSLIDRVVTCLVAQTEVDPGSLMLVGAQCRDIWDAALGYDVRLRRTRDLDFGVAVRGLDSYESVVDRLSRIGDTGIAFQVSGMPVDLMPFGPEVERPLGLVEPRSRRGSPFSVFGFSAVRRRSVHLRLPSGLRVRMASPAGLALLKIAAWHDRIQWGANQDGLDLAVLLRWHRDSAAVEASLWAEDPPVTLPAFDYDVTLAAAHVCGRDARAILDEGQRSELERLWLDSKDGLASALRDSGELGSDETRLTEIVGSFGVGVTAHVS